MRILFSVLFLAFSFGSISQLVHPANSDAFKQDEVAKIYITMNSQDFNTMVGDSLGSTYEFPASFIYISSTLSDTMASIGIRLRGNTSLQSAKKSFKLDFNAYVPGQKWEDLKSMNLNGEHNDVSIMRARTCHEMLRWAGCPVARSSYVELYINGTYKGLYLNVEHLDDQFLEARFIGNAGGNLYKAQYGADLTNLGSNPNAYVPLYELKTNQDTNDYSGLIHFIEVLNNTSNAEFPCAIQEVLDVDLCLKTMALEVLAAHWDGYIVNKNNYYLYQRPSDGKFVYIEYDVDNTFGVDWFSIDWQTRNIYLWALPNTQRPLYYRLMQVPYFKDRFSYYINLHCQQFFNPTFLLSVWNQTQGVIAPSALSDTYKGLDYGFTNADFMSAISQNWGSHIPVSLNEHVTLRHSSALSQSSYLGLVNPCSLSLTESIDLDAPIPVSYYDVLGRILLAPPANQVYLVRYNDGSTRQFYSIAP